MENSLAAKLANKRVSIVSHIFATGPALDLEHYLQNNVEDLTFIGHPFSYVKDIASFIRTYHKGKKIVDRKARPWKLPEVLMFFKDTFYTFLWMVGQPKSDLFVGSDNLSAFAGLILKKLGLVGKVVYYTIDFVPQRFNNKYLNEFYHWVDKQCVLHCDIVWNVSPRIAEGRERVRGLKQSQASKQIVVPLGAWFDRIPRADYEQINKTQLVFMGNLLEKQGVQLVLEAIPQIVQKVANFSFLIIGTGPYEEQLKKQAEALGVSDCVKFTGYVKDHRDIEAMLAKSAVAVAPYSKELDTFSYYADPGKIKNYLAAGLPIVLTDVPQIAKTVDEQQCGILVPYDKDALSEAVIHLMLDENRLKQYRYNAVEMAKEFDWNNVFAEGLRQTL